MTQRFSRLGAKLSVVFWLVVFSAKSEASSQTLDEQFQNVIVPSFDGWFVASEEDVLALMRRGIAERDTKFLIGLLWTQERLVFSQALKSIPRLPTQEKYEFLSLMVAEDSFWRNLNYATDTAAEIQTRQQGMVIASVEHMIQQEVSSQEFYDEPRRRELQRIVADVVKNGLPNRDPNWKPKEFVGDPSPKTARVINDPLKKQTNAAAQTPMAASPPPSVTRPNVGSPTTTDAPERSATSWLVSVGIALIVLAAAAVVIFKKYKC